MRYFLAGTCATICRNTKLPRPQTQRHRTAMLSNLSALFDLRCNAEKEAEQALGAALAARQRAEDEQQRLNSAAEEGRQRLARAAKLRAAGTPSVAALGLQHERYRQRLAAALAQATAKADQHRQGPLQQAQAAEQAAAARVGQAKQERQAIEKLIARQAAEERKQADRRAEDAAGDWVHSSQGRRKP